MRARLRGDLPGGVVVNNLDKFLRVEDDMIRLVNLLHPPVTDLPDGAESLIESIMLELQTSLGVTDLQILASQGRS